jgi:hypothetical protein
MVALMKGLWLEGTRQGFSGDARRKRFCAYSSGEDRVGRAAGVYVPRWEDVFLFSK